MRLRHSFFFFFQAEDGIRDLTVTGVQTCALPISRSRRVSRTSPRRAPVRRKRRSRTSGYELMPKEYGSRSEPAYGPAGERAEDRADANEPGRLDADAAPRARVVERRPEEPRRVREGQEVTDPPGERHRA